MIGIKKTNKNRGFTIIETVVVIAIFLLIIGVGLSIFISVVSGQRKILSEQKVINQLSYAMEHISKALRMAKMDTNHTCIGTGANYMYALQRQNISKKAWEGIKSINQSNSNACTEFFLENGILYEHIDSGSDVPLTSSDIEITNIRFGIDGKTGCYSSDQNEFERCPSGFNNNSVNQPRITVVLSFRMKNTQDAPKTIQTTISARNLNVPTQ